MSKNEISKKIDRPKGGIDANCVREGAPGCQRLRLGCSRSPLTTLAHARPLRNTQAPMTTRLLLRRGPRHRTRRRSRQHSSR